MVTCSGNIIVNIISINTLSLDFHLKIENAYATKELEIMVPIIVRKLITIELYI